MTLPDDPNRIDFENPRPEDIKENMMLRVGMKRQKPERWKAAISLEVSGDKVRALFWPGGTDEYEEWIPINTIRLAWWIPGVDFYSLCHRATGEFFGKRKFRTLH